jgi:vacuolar-type H+-ATPase subunit H
MEGDILSEVIKVEKEIKARLEAEEQKAEGWLEQVRKDTEEGVSEARVRLQELLEKTVSEAEADAHGRAFKMLEDAALRAERMRELGDETLRALVKRHIPRILPYEP